MYWGDIYISEEVILAALLTDNLHLHRLTTFKQDEESTTKRST